MNYFSYLRQKILEILLKLEKDEVIPKGLDHSHITVEFPRDPKHGDLSTNAAMVLAKLAKLKPSDLAGLIIEHLTLLPEVNDADAAGPGFINIRLSSNFWWDRLREIVADGTNYGNSDIGRGIPVNIEYVSANPTGPLHVGHARGAVIGDALASILSKAGYNVTKEYYINDAGTQVDVLARSLYLRYQECHGAKIEQMPDGLYPGSYLIDIAKLLKEKDGDKWMSAREKEWLEPFRKFAIDAMMDLIREDLDLLGVRHDHFSSETIMVEKGRVNEVVKYLEGQGLTYTGILEAPKGKKLDDWEERPQTLFRSTQFGDDIDRPVKKSDGNWTYFASDMAYHLDKFKRGFSEMIDIMGADHGGYIKRMDAAVSALTQGQGSLDVKLCHMVNLMENGKSIKMSKRSGAFTKLRDVLDLVGKDVVRFIMLTRKNDAPLDFDLRKVLEKSRDNPVYYVQYSHARCHSVLRHAKEVFDKLELTPDAIEKAPLELLSDSAELLLIKQMAAWPRTLESAAEAREPHRIAYYLIELSGTFHALWTKGAKEDTSLRFVSDNNKQLTLARLVLVGALASVIASGLQVIGVEPVKEMK